MIKDSKNTPTHLIAASIALVVGLFFSYQPTFFLGKSSGANLEISITQISVALFILVSLFVTYKFRKNFPRNKGLMIILGLATLNSVSLLWTDNPTRGIVLTLLLWAIVALWFTLLARYADIQKNSALLIKIGFITTLGIVAFACFQIFADALNVSPSITLLPETYRSQVFGFARPTSFALEPQFLGSLLLLPALYAAYLEVIRKSSLLSRIVLISTVTVLFTTISRGAYIGFGAALLILFAVHVRNNSRSLLKMLLLVLVGFTLSLGIIGTSAQLNARDDTSGLQAIAKTVNHLSLDLIDIKISSPQPTIPASNNAVPETDNVPLQIGQTPSIDSGYVAESTNSRLLMTREALSLWLTNPLTTLFGIGVGSFGATLHSKDPVHSISSIVNNQYVEVLVETGILGLTLFLLVLGLLLYLSVKYRLWLVTIVLVAYYLQWLFFSGSVNVLHVWTFMGLSYAYLFARTSSKKD